MPITDSDNRIIVTDPLSVEDQKVSNGSTSFLSPTGRLHCSAHYTTERCDTTSGRSENPSCNYSQSFFFFLAPLEAPSLPPTLLMFKLLPFSFLSDILPPTP